jgi:hypothetical protein
VPKKRACGSFFRGQALLAPRIGWIKVALLSLSIAGVYLGIGSSNIVYSAGNLGVGSAEWQLPAKEKAHSFASVSLVYAGVSFGASSKSKLIEINHTQ